MTKIDLKKIVVEALNGNNGSASIIDICKFVWNKYEKELFSAGDLFYTWQYDIRWAATLLRRDHILESVENSPRGVWCLKK